MNMNWQSQDGVTFTKPLGKTEMPFCYFGFVGQDQGRENWAVHTVAELQLPATADPEPIFRKAWAALRLDLPDIDTRHDVVTQTKTYTSFTDAADLKQWVDATFHVEKGLASGDAIVEKLRASQRPTCHMLDLGKGRVSILINCSHARLDGFGSMHVMNRFLTFAASPAHTPPTPGTEGAKLIRNFEEIVGDRTPNPDKIVRRVSDRLAAYFSALPFAGLPLDTAPTGVFGDTRILTRVISSDATAAFAAACKSKGVTVTSAIQSALVDVTYSHTPPENRNRKLGLITPINIRRHVPALQDGDTHAVGIFMGCLHLLSHADEGFLARAQRLSNEYSLSKDSEWLAHEVTELSVQVAAMLAGGVPPPPAPPSAPVLSSLGVVDDVVAHRHGDIEVLSVRVGGQMLTAESLVYAWTFRGRLHLAFNYNTAFFHDASIANWLAEILQRLSVELGVPLAGEIPCDASGW